MYKKNMDLKWWEGVLCQVKTLVVLMNVNLIFFFFFNTETAVQETEGSLSEVFGSNTK